MKPIVAILSLVGLLNACTAQTDRSSEAVKPVDNSIEPAASSPTPPSKSDNTASGALNFTKPTVPLPELVSDEDKSYSDRFDFHIRNIIANADTVKFQSRKYDFVFNRDSNSWSVKPGSLPNNFVFQEEKHWQALQAPVNPPYETMQFKDKTYQYRVTRQGQSEAPDCKPEAKVVIELITPNSKQPKNQTLYTGGCLSFPYITAAKVDGDRLWWSLAFPQGEGYTGKTTLVSYHPQQDKWTVIHPEGMEGQEILDFAIAGNPERPTFWMATKLSGEGENYIPGMGLVAYRPNSSNLQSGSVTSYRVDNSPLIGAIPDKLKLESDKLWVGTGSGVCQLQLQAPDHPKSWNCWRFALMAELPTEGLPLYSALLEQKSAVTLNSVNAGQTVEVLWWLFTDFTSTTNFMPRRKGRYEVRYDKGFTAKLDKWGATLWSDHYSPSVKPPELPVWLPPVSWSGMGWHWNGDTFVRGFDEVCECPRGGGPDGIARERFDANIYAMRGDLELLNLSRASTSVKYYSGWVDDAKLKPYPTVVPQERPSNPQPNPLEAVAKQLQSSSSKSKQ